MARDDRTLDAFRLEHGRRRGGEVVHRGATSERPGACVAREIDCDHAVARDERGHHLDPVPRRATEPVDEQHGLSLTADVVLDGAREPGLEGRCSRHPGKVSLSDYGDCGGAGPLIPANNERAMSEPA